MTKMTMAVMNSPRRRGVDSARGVGVGVQGSRSGAGRRSSEVTGGGYRAGAGAGEPAGAGSLGASVVGGERAEVRPGREVVRGGQRQSQVVRRGEIGRASCRERA